MVSPDPRALRRPGIVHQVGAPGPRRLGPGRIDPAATGEGGYQGLVMEGATVRGAVLGALEVSRVSDSTFVEIVGRKAYRDTVPLRASCRLGPWSDGSPATEGRDPR